MKYSGVSELVLSEMQERSKKRIYTTDPEAWLWDVLGKRWWSKQAEIAHDVVGTGDGQTFTMVKSANGTGKTALGADLMTWAISVHDPLETTVLATANVFTQISQNAFRYIADNYSEAQARGLYLPGRIVSDPAVRFDRGPGMMPKDIIIGRRPADKNLISSFQGTHDGFVMVLLDEAGGLPEDLWTGVYAVTTNEHVAVLAIANPDELNTGLHRRWQDEERFSEWKRHTISAYDTPNFTGEMLYPDDLGRDAAVKRKMIQVSWAERMQREAHPNVFRSKVLGEFPESSDTSFFVQSAIEKAWNTEIEPEDDALRTLGVDLSFQGEDKTVYYINHGGKIRLAHSFNKLDDYMEHARLIDEWAKRTAADIVQIDANGPGGGVYSNLLTEFPNRTYQLVGIMGGRAASDNSRWTAARSEHYDDFREAMQMGKVDLDPEDTELRDQLFAQTFEISDRGAIQVTPKKRMIKSPDYLDAAILSYWDQVGRENGEASKKLHVSEPEDIPDFGLHELISGKGWPM